MVQQGVMTAQARAKIEALRPVADINHWMFDEQGRCINNLLEPPPFFLSGLDMSRLKERIQRSRVKVVLVAGGSPAYVPAIRAVFKAGLANILVTDHVTAQLLLLNA
jgi:DNA-binding transcriptional regulator LsrR (DeoR family)